MPDSRYFHQSISQAAALLARKAALAKSAPAAVEADKTPGPKPGSPAPTKRSLEQPNRSKAQNRYAKKKSKAPY